MKIWIIAKIGFRECLRYRLVYFIFIMALLFILMGKGCNPGTIKGNDLFFDKDTRQNMAMEIAFHGIVFWSIMLCGLVSASLLSRELDEGTAVMTLGRPLSRSSYILGKLLSIIMITVLNLFLLGSIFFLLFYFEFGYINFRIFASFALMISNLLMFALMGLLLSLFVPRIITPLICIFIYLGSIWSALPYNFEKLSIIWEPSETVRTLHDFLPRFGDVQFISASLITSVPALEELTLPLCSGVLYCLAFWFLLVFTFKRKQI